MNQSLMESITSPNRINYKRFNPLINLGIMASGKGTNLEAIIKSINKKELDAKINCLIVNNKNCGAKEKADIYGIPCIILDHREFSSREELDRSIVNVFKTYNVELIVMAGWMRIVTPVLINSYLDKIINIHPSLLPSFKGSDAIKQAINSNVKITGCSVHIVTEELDSGEILVQSAIAINPEDNEKSVTTKIQKEEHKILTKGIILAAQKIRG